MKLFIKTYALGLISLVFLITFFGSSPLLAAIKWWPVKHKTAVGPWQFYGSFGYDYTNKMIKGDRPDAIQTSTSELHVGKSIAGYLWKPWLVQWSNTTILDLTFSKQNIWSNNSGSNASDESILTQSLSGDLKVKVLPKSRFPFQLSASRKNGDSSKGELSGGGVKVVDKVGLKQDYTNKKGDLKTALRYEYGRNRSGGNGSSGAFGIIVPSFDSNVTESTHHTVSMSGRKSSKKHSFDLKTKLAHFDKSDDTTSSLDNSATLSLSHIYSGKKTWGVTSMLIVTADDGENENEESKTFSNSQTNQLSSSAFWRSAKLPLSVTGLGRLALNNKDTRTQGQSDEEKTTNYIGDLDISASYSKSYSTALKLNALLNGKLSYEQEVVRLEGSAKETEQDLVASSTQSVRVTYQPERIVMGPYTYNWYTSGSANNKLATGSSQTQSLSEMISHGLSRRVLIGDNSDLNLNISESLTNKNTSGLKPLWSLAHSFDGTLKWYGKSMRALFSLTTADTRSYVRELAIAQNLKAQVAADGILMNKTTWQGKATSEWNKTTSSEESKTEQKSSVSIQLAKRNMFNIRRLQFSSTISYDFGDQFLPIGSVVGDPEESETRSWWNTFDYRIGMVVGRLQAGASEKYSVKNGLEQEGLIKLEIKRFFEASF
ncbi:MAG: hypothetical protein HQL69_01940 [Magnetococcales bacterium]|nr:hypothetical protein [Magnetococcales bacterium]